MGNDCNADLSRRRRRRQRGRGAGSTRWWWRRRSPTSTTPASRPSTTSASYGSAKPPSPAAREGGAVVAVALPCLPLSCLASASHGSAKRAGLRPPLPPRVGQTGLAVPRRRATAAPSRPSAARASRRSVPLARRARAGSERRHGLAARAPPPTVDNIRTRGAVGPPVPPARA